MTDPSAPFPDAGPRRQAAIFVAGLGGRKPREADLAVARAAARLGIPGCRTPREITREMLVRAGDEA